jgi:hypothetical protein
LVFGRLWRLGLTAILEELLADRRYEFAVEASVFVTVLHRLMASGSDRAAEALVSGLCHRGSSDLPLHHLYQAMAWLGEELGADQQPGPPGSRALRQDRIEEALFARRQTLFSNLDLVFFDTTSVYFERPGRRDDRPARPLEGSSAGPQADGRGAVLDGTGRPLCCELWPGSTTDVKTLVPIVDRRASASTSNASASWRIAA